MSLLTHSGPPSVMARPAEIPEEEIWLAKQKSARTRRAYRSRARFHCLEQIRLSAGTRDDSVTARVCRFW